MPRATIALCLALLALPGQIMAQGKGIRLWNLTTSTISGFQLSPAGKNDWGPNQTLNDKDKEVDHDERLRITGVEPGTLRCQGRLSRQQAMHGARHRDQGGRRVLDPGQGSEGLQQIAAAPPATASAQIFSRAVRIFAAPFHRSPFWMLADPLRDVRLRAIAHCCSEKLAENTRCLLLATGRREHRTDCHDQVDRIHSDVLRAVPAIDSTTQLRDGSNPVSPVT